MFASPFINFVSGNPARRTLNFRWHIDQAVMLSLPSGNCRTMFCPLRADVAQLVEQRFRKPQVTGSNPVVGSSLRSQQRGSESCHAVASAQADRLIPSNFLLRATAWQALDSEL